MNVPTASDKFIDRILWGWVGIILARREWKQISSLRGKLLSPFSCQDLFSFLLSEKECWRDGCHEKRRSHVVAFRVLTVMKSEAAWIAAVGPAVRLPLRALVEAAVLERQWGAQPRVLTESRVHVLTAVVHFHATLCGPHLGIESPWIRMNER